MSRIDSDGAPGYSGAVFVRAHEGARAGVLSNLVRELAAHDWILLTTTVVLLLAIAAAPASAAREEALRAASVPATILTLAILIGRTRPWRGNPIAGLLYRAGVIATPIFTYLSLAEILPVVNTAAHDVELYELDLALFGFEPAMVMDAFVTPVTTEWFAFFYFSYFGLVALYTVPSIFYVRGTTVVTEFAIGMLTIFSVAHTVYMLVPGYGPVHAMSDAFTNALPAGYWMNLVNDTVTAAGAQKDIFPSLHTAVPTLITLFSFRHRRLPVFRLIWPVVAFFAANIIIATMFLRWHYEIDVIAGLVIAYGVSRFAAQTAAREARDRGREGLSQAWPAIRRR